jgi:hypothetical protein
MNRERCEDHSSGEREDRQRPLREVPVAEQSKPREGNDPRARDC